MDDIIHTLHDITVTLYDIIRLYLWDPSHCIHDIRSYTCDITSRVYDILSPIPVTSLTLCLWIHINNIYHETHGAETIHPLYLKSQPPYVYLCVHTQCIHDISHTVLMTLRLLYIWNTMHCVCIWYLTHDLWHNNTLSITSVYYISYKTSVYYISYQTDYYLTAHPLYLCHHTQIIGHITTIVYMITQAQYVWHHMNTYDITSTLYDITPRYDIHTHCIHVITPRIPVFASTVAELLLTVYWL